MRLGLPWCAAVESQDVGATRELDDDRIFGAVRVVVFGEFYAKTPGLDADHGIELRIEVRGAAENFGRNLILLDGSAGMVESMFGEIAQELTQLLRPMQGVAVHQLIDLTEILISFGQVGPRDKRFNRSVTTRASLCKARIYGA
jgi:hypothetical protein